MEQNLIIYHGSQQIVEVPRFGVGKTYNDYVRLKNDININKIESFYSIKYCKYKF